MLKGRYPRRERLIEATSPAKLIENLRWKLSTAHEHNYTVRFTARDISMMLELLDQKRLDGVNLGRTRPQPQALETGAIAGSDGWVAPAELAGDMIREQDSTTPRLAPTLMPATE